MFFNLLVRISLVLGVFISSLFLLLAIILIFAPKILSYILVGVMILFGIYLLTVSIAGISLLKNTDR